MPHICRSPKHYTGNTTAFTPTSTKEYNRTEFFKLLDAVDVQLTECFDQSSFHSLSKLERVRISGKEEDVVDSYPELNWYSLEVQLVMQPEVRGLFTQVEVLVRLLLVVPCSSAEA